MPSFRPFNDLAVEELFRQPCLAIPPFRAFSNDLAPEIEPLWKELTWGYSADLPTLAAFSPDIGDNGSLILRFVKIDGEDDAYAVAHELYHAILNQRDYPTWKPRHDPPDPGLSRVMYKFLNQIQHLLINPALQDYGFAVFDWWQREDWQPFRDSFMWNLCQYVGLMGSPAIFERLETALRWSQLELEHFALSGKSPSDEFYTLRLPFSDAAMMAEEIVQNVKEIGWNTPAQQRALLVWFVEAYELDVEIVGLGA